MAGGHSHAHGDVTRVRVSLAPRILLLAILALAAVVAVFGLVKLWPDQARVDRATSDIEFAAPGVTFPHAEVDKLGPPCEADSLNQGQADQSGSMSPTCGLIDTTVTTGATKGEHARVQLPGPAATAGLESGDHIQLMLIPAQAGTPAQYSFFGIDRTYPLALFTALFVLVVVVVARWRGLLALVGLGFSGFVLVKFMLPALLAGESGIAVAVVGSVAIMYVVLYLAHGPSIRTSTALAGTLFGIATTALLAHYAVGENRLSGIGDESGAFLSGLVGTLNFRGLLTCAIIVAGLGVLNDVTITQSSAVWELRAAGPELTRRQLYASAMRIGRDHIASTIYTIVFAYTGAALSVLLLLFLYDRPVLDLLSTEDIATEVIRTLCSAIGLVLAVPVTTAIAASTVSGAVRAIGTAPGTSSAPAPTR